MSQKTKKQLQQELSELNTEKEQLLAVKKEDEKAFTKEQQERLSEVTEAAVDIEEQIELLPDEAPDEAPAEKTAGKGDDKTTSKPANKKSYKVPKGTENMVHVMLAQGNRYDPKTGKEINKPVFQMFTFGEWGLFKKNYKLLGYTIADVLHNPYGDAKELVGK